MSICAICCDTYAFKAVTECGHETCAKCWLTEKHLCQRGKCLFCSKEKAQSMILPSSLKLEAFRYMKVKPFMSFNSKYKVYVHSSAEIYISQLENPACPVCNQQFLQFSEMQLHLQNKHSLQYCKTCSKSKPVFKIDQQFFSSSDLKAHLSTHPTCKLCSFKQYDDTYLQDHYKIQHLRCEICRTFGVNDSFWDTQKDLQSHIKSAHFSCTFIQCNNDGFGFCNEEEQLDHLIEIHASQLTSGQLSEYKNKLSLIRRSKKLVDLNQLTTFQNLYSISNRKISSDQKGIMTTQYQQEAENMYLQDYLAQASVVPKQAHKQAQGIQQYIDYVEPQIPQQQYKGITKQSIQDINFGINLQPATPAGMYSEIRPTPVQQEVNPFQSTFGFKIKKVKTKTTKTNEQEKQQKAITNIQTNMNILDNGLYEEFTIKNEEIEETQPQQLFEITKLEQEQLKDEEPIQKTNLFGIPIKIVKAKKNQQQQITINNSDEVLFNPYVNVPQKIQLFAPVAVKKQTTIENIGSIKSNDFISSIKIVKQKQKKPQEQIFEEDVDFDPIIKKQTPVELFKIQQPRVMNDLTNNQNEQLDLIQVTKVKQKNTQYQPQQKINVITETKSQNQSQQGNHIIITQKQKKQPKHQSIQQQEIVETVDLTLTKEELNMIRNPQPKLAQPALIKQQPPSKNLSNNIIMQINNIFPLMPSEIALARYVDSKLVATLCITFGFSIDLISKLTDQFRTFSSVQKQAISDKQLQFSENYLQNTYKIDPTDVVINKISDYRILKFTIQQFCTESRLKILDISAINSKCQIEVFDSISKNEDYKLHLVNLSDDIILTRVLSVDHEFSNIFGQVCEHSRGCRKHKTCALDSVKAQKLQ
ncbi:RING Zn-finger domain-containing protein [Spironucleus salmonicida]|uniref:RING Zn-finger domain-containing protein n=1 Tax=Spironucleus salmonicida TaxID=348837 RepID=V6LHB9_9EUKA|nr:RING Zn-finger domain-containing protein [Spironucleus salmonicida]|eukprot:EST43678.1 hypothetical protein SS50377_16724 [Spironucleus salmonicida]